MKHSEKKQDVLHRHHHSFGWSDNAAVAAAKSQTKRNNKKRRLHIYKVCIYQNHCHCKNTHLPAHHNYTYLMQVSSQTVRSSVDVHAPYSSSNTTTTPFTSPTFSFFFSILFFPSSFSHITYLFISSTSNLLHMTLDLHHRFHLYFRIRSRPRPSPRGDSTFV